MTHRTTRLAAVVLAIASPALAMEEATSFESAIKEGSYGGMMRYRADYFDQDNGEAIKAGLASTLRTSLNYRTKPFYGSSAYVDLYHVASLGRPRYSHAGEGGGDPNRDFIADPVGMGVNEGYFRLAPASMPFKATVGRQLFTLNDETFVTASRYRQNMNRFDAATAEFMPFEGLTIEGGQLWHNVDVFDNVVSMRTPVANIAYQVPDVVRVAAYGIFLDYTKPTGTDRKTIGARVSGPYKVDDKLGIIYEADYAQQTEAFDTVAEIDATMLTARAGLSYDQWYASLGFRQASGVNDSSTAAFQSSDIGYPWPWRGNSEQFVFNPADGLQTIMLWAGGAVPGVAGLSFDVFYFNFSGVEEGDDFGNEISGGMNYQITPRWSIYGLATSASAADDASPFKDATRLTGMTTFTF